MDVFSYDILILILVFVQKMFPVERSIIFKFKNTCIKTQIWMNYTKYESNNKIAKLVQVFPNFIL